MWRPFKTSHHATSDLQITREPPSINKENSCYSKLVVSLKCALNTSKMSTSLFGENYLTESLQYKLPHVRRSRNHFQHAKKATIVLMASLSKTWAIPFMAQNPSSVPVVISTNKRYYKWDSFGFELRTNMTNPTYTGSRWWKNEAYLVCAKICQLLYGIAPSPTNHCTCVGQVFCCGTVWWRKRQTWKVRWILYTKTTISLRLWHAVLSYLSLPIAICRYNIASASAIDCKVIR